MIEHADQVHRAVRRFCRSDADYDDLMQDAWLGALARWDHYDESCGDAATWVYFSAIRGIQDGWRERDRLTRTQRQALKRWTREADAALQLGVPVPPMPDDVFRASHANSVAELHDWQHPRDDYSPEVRVLRQETANELRLLVAGLPGVERITTHLYYWKEMPLASIGDAIGVTESRASQIKAAAIQRIRRTLGVAA